MLFSLIPIFLRHGEVTYTCFNTSPFGPAERERDFLHQMTFHLGENLFTMSNSEQSDKVGAHSTQSRVILVVVWSTQTGMVNL